MTTTQTRNTTEIMVIHDPWDARGRKVTVDLDQADEARAKVQDYLETKGWDEDRAEEKAAKLVQSELDERAAEQEREEKKQSQREAAIAEAKETGERVQISTHITRCDGSATECSQDEVSEYALPSGETETERIHLH